MPLRTELIIYFFDFWIILFIVVFFVNFFSLIRLIKTRIQDRLDRRSLDYFLNRRLRIFIGFKWFFYRLDYRLIIF
jgi:hypothetical protein